MQTRDAIEQALRCGGMTAQEIADATGCSVSAIMYALRYDDAFVAVGSKPNAAQNARAKVWKLASMVQHEKQQVAALEKAVRQADNLIDLANIIRQLSVNGAHCAAIEVAKLWQQEDAELKRLCGGVA